MNSKIIKGVKEYYAEKINQHGNTSLGVDWNSKESQYLRFEQLCKVIDVNKNFSVLDYGCGYAELINYLDSNFTEYKYIGYDISEEMITKAHELFSGHQSIELNTEVTVTKLDYVVASGIFNVKLNLADEQVWLKYIIDTLDSFDKLSTKGFSFNALTSYSDIEYKKDYLYYADPLFIFDYCKKNFSKNVALLHDYQLYEFTIIVRK